MATEALRNTDSRKWRTGRITRGIKLVGFAGVGALLLPAACSDSDPSGPTGTDPSITAVSPSEGTVGTELEISGSDFEPEATVTVGGEEADEVEVTSSVIYARVPAGIEAEEPLDVAVTNPGGASAAFSGAFTGVAPDLDFVNSATKPSGNPGSTVILEGRAFGDRQGEGRVLFSDGEGGTLEAEIQDPEDDWTDSFILTTVPSDAEDGPVSVETPTGTSEGMEFIVTSGAAFSPSTIEWTVTTALPDPVSGHAAVHTSVADEDDGSREFVQVAGGRDGDGEATTRAFSGEIDQQGEIVAWNEGASLPEPVSFHATAAATPFNAPLTDPGYLYVLGGTDEDGDATSTVHRGALAEDGTVESWGSESPLPEPLHSFEAVIFRGAIYIAGGATGDDEPVDRVYRAEVDTLGALGEWEEQASLPSERAHHTLSQFGGRLYAVGGDAEAVDPGAADDGDSLDEVAYARVNLRNGEITDDGWTLNENELTKGQSKHSTVVAGGNLFVTSGLYSGQPGSTENQYAQIRSDGSVDEFQGATGSNTLHSEGGTHLFNQAAITYVDGDGVARVMVLGGDDVEDPGSPQETVLYY